MAFEKKVHNAGIREVMEFEKALIVAMDTAEVLFEDENPQERTHVLRIGANLDLATLWELRKLSGSKEITVTDAVIMGKGQDDIDSKEIGAYEITRREKDWMNHVIKEALSMIKKDHSGVIFMGPDNRIYKRFF